ncbi:MAG: hypothetical protein MZV64_31465 [Ignavibacteriales bacterium]|nr:hypothetical protein [Ignavibacteriales bacterium]
MIRSHACSPPENCTEHRSRRTAGTTGCRNRCTSRIMLQLGNDIPRKRVDPDGATLREIGEIDLARPFARTIPHTPGIVWIRIDANAAASVVHRSAGHHAGQDHLALQRRDTRRCISLIERRHPVHILPTIQMTDGDPLRRKTIPVRYRITRELPGAGFSRIAAETCIVPDAVIIPVELAHQAGS